ncbi:hypothetical protein [Cytophaga aurantiaca]|uniref:hypothetical protein n=1 Tax=Cytophaga aurantiaca TaxID=29530 RepID=UPI0003637410|nr:hypothetical protein [Cytophaga aurantiaca]
MHTVDVLTSDCTALRSNILFLKKEISFLLKILGNCYSSSIHAEQLKLQDGYWKHFEEQQIYLDTLDVTVQKEESKLINLYLEGLIHAETVMDKQGKLQASFDACYNELKSLKESFYTFMNGCNACALKTAC